MKSDEDEPKAEERPPPLTIEEVNKSDETPTLDVVGEELAELNKEPVPELETRGIQENAIDVIKGESEIENVEIQAEKEPDDQPTAVDIPKTLVEADEGKGKQVEELHANEPEKSEVSEPVAVEGNGLVKNEQDASGAMLRALSEKVFELEFSEEMSANVQSETEEILLAVTCLMLCTGRGISLYGMNPPFETARDQPIWHESAF